jgi:hypothetical protein
MPVTVMICSKVCCAWPYVHDVRSGRCGGGYRDHGFPTGV